MEKRLTTKIFIERANELHGDTYDYSLVEYKNGRTKIKIICKKHGKFEQLPSIHLTAQGCSKCSREPKYNYTFFLERAIKIYNNKYTYPPQEIKGYNDDVIVDCHEHGIFKTKVNLHLKGSECKACKNKKYLEDRGTVLLQKFKKQHGDKFDYSVFKYTGIHDKHTFICKKHGIFEAHIKSHLYGNGGCTKCGHNSSKDKQLKPQKAFFETCDNIHNNFYDYSNTFYKGCKESITICCPTHGNFNQQAGEHLRGVGCPKCNKSNGEVKISKILDQLNLDYIEQKRFDECKNKKHLSFDFYLPSYNLLVEYNGEQHYKPISFFGGVNGYKKQLINDAIKKDFCTKNEIYLLIIPYTEYKNIGEIIKTKLKKHIN